MPFPLQFLGSYAGALSSQWSARPLATVLAIQTGIQLGHASVRSVGKRGCCSAVDLLPGEERALPSASLSMPRMLGDPSHMRSTTMKRLPHVEIDTKNLWRAQASASSEPQLRHAPRGLRRPRTLLAVPAAPPGLPIRAMPGTPAPGALVSLRAAGASVPHRRHQLDL